MPVPMATNVHLTPELESFARACVEGGNYNNVSEVVRSGLRLLKEQEERKRAFDAMIARTLEETDDKGTRTDGRRAGTRGCRDRGRATVTRAVLSPAAERDILEIIEWIAAENPIAARGFRVAVDRLATAIGVHPRIGAMKPHLASPPIRLLRIRGFPHVVVFTPERSPPLIVRVLHGARDLPEVLRES